jgi:hypothetical protein
LSGSNPARALACLAILPTLAGVALAQQFVDVTDTRFPQPKPSEYTSQLTIGDLDGDGDLDIIFANGNGFSCPVAPQLARVYINNGSGFFTDETMARTGGYSGRHRGVELGDCDRDDDLDVILVQDCNFLPGLLINDGSGFFTSEGATRLPNITLASSRGQFGDVDNDGDLDLFITSGTNSRFDCGQYRLYLNDGTCHYTDATGVNFPLGNKCNNMDAIFGDIDNDFDIDIRTASTGTNNSVLYRNDGTGTFGEVAGVPADQNCYSYDFGDIDGDGDIDLLGANGLSGSNGEILLENDGTGTYTDVSSNISPNPNQDDNDSKFIDYDNDGDLDLVIARLGSPGEKMYNNDGTGNFTLISGVVEPVPDSSLDIKVADLTGDGAYDIVTAQGESGAPYYNLFYVNNGPADTLPPTIVDTEQVSDPDDVGPYVVRALILDHMTSDRNFFDKGIQLKYTVDRGAEQTVDMLHNGGQVYRGEIPGQPGGSEIDYHVTATDFNDNTTAGPVQSFLVPDCGSINDCSGHGVCVGVDVCDCDLGWGGEDCSEFFAVAAGRVPDGTVGTERPLTVRKFPNGNLRVSWDPSCGVDANDIDYALYEGLIGDFTSHVPVTCGTGGALSVLFTPGSGNRYYLAVPRSVNSEGSYGLDSSLAERPPSLAACAVQEIACP